ncbi:MAG: type II toxin-antitoxin system VapC family toxin [Bacteroidetes bacterium]|nr:type II toxin-antitoxin system VapC family toxin [Bacteroidota bacterium]
MRRETPRMYADTSVFGGVIDDEFSRPSVSFFDLVRRGDFHLVVSDVIRRELIGAPEAVTSVWREVLPLAEVVDITEDALGLQRAYLDAGILTTRSAEDALHVALATVHECKVIVSWNFRHIVHYEKIEKYNAVNVLEGFETLAIHSPLEVTGYGNQDEEI